MKCKCGSNDFVIVTKPISQKDIKRDSIVQLSICKTCDPDYKIWESLNLLSDGFIQGCKYMKQED
jgi:hypothetical protein